MAFNLTTRWLPVLIGLVINGCGEEIDESMFQDSTAAGESVRQAHNDTPARPDTPVAPELKTLASTQAKGMVPVSAGWSGTLQEGGHRDVQVVLDQGGCYRVLASGGPGLEDLDLLLFDSNGLLELQDTARDAQPVLGLVPPLCPDGAGVYRLRIRSHRGGDRYVAQLFVTD